MLSSRRFVLATSLALLPAGLTTAQTPATTSFTYQGELASSGTPASGTYDLRFRLFDTPSGGSQVGPSLCSDNLAVSAGRFAATLDFGPAAFNGQKRFLEIEVRTDAGQDCSDPCGFTVLAPRQELTASPLSSFALTAGSAATANNALSLGGQPSTFFTSAANLTGTLPPAVLPSNVARTDANQIFTGQLTLSNPDNILTGNGAGLTNLSGTAITQGTISRSTLSSDVQSGLASASPLEWALTPYELATALPGLATPTSAAAWGNYFAGRSLNNSGSVRLYDTSSPLSPVAGATITGLGSNSNTSSIAGTGTTLYVAASDGVRVYDVQNINAPSLVRTLTGSADTRLLVENGLLAVTTTNGLQLYSVADPANPSLLSTIPTTTSANAVAISGNRLYFYADPSVFVYNIQSPAAPALLGSLSVPVAYTLLAVSGTTVYATRTDGFVALDIINAANPAALSRTSAPLSLSFPSALIVSGNHLLTTNGSSSQLITINISDAFMPAVVTATNVQSSRIALGRSALYAFGSSGMVPITPAPAARLAAPIAGSGAALTGINAANITTGTLSVARLPALDAGLITTGTLNSARLPALDAGLITTGTLSTARLPALDASLITTGTLNAARLPTSVARTDTANTFGNFINSFSGNVGIGTATPSRPLSFGTALTDKIALYDATNDFWGFGMSAGALQIKTGNNERMRITNSGVSIGTTATPTKALEVYGAGNINGLRVRGDNNTSFSMGRGSTDEFEIGIASGFGNFSNFANTGDTIFRTIAATPGKIHLQGGTGNAAITISGTQVGIGTPNPTNPLTVAGNMNVTGSIAKAGGSFLIDHPLDPENKYLYHSFVESPDMMNIYNGVITTDARGLATVELPDYFDALNRDFRYQLTVLDESENDFILAKVYREIGVEAPRQFTIKSSLPNTKVSWQVTGIRKDAWAEKNRIPNAVDKPAAEKGTLLHPEAFGQTSAGAKR